jgi:rare lipoprotein A (peptidoglycan hydrolase)
MTKNDLLKHLYTDQFKEDEMRDAMSRARLIPIIIAVLTVLFIIILIFSKVHAQQIPQPTYITASWYSNNSLKKEGTYKYSKGVMANGQLFRDEGFTCATWLYPLGTRIRVTDIKTGRHVYVTVTDRISRKFSNTRIDLSRAAFARLFDLTQGLSRVKVEAINFYQENHKIQKGGKA